MQDIFIPDINSNGPLTNDEVVPNVHDEHDGVEAPKDDNIEVDRDVAVEAPGDDNIEVDRDVAVEPPRDDNIEVDRDVAVEAPGDDNIEVDRDVAVEAPGDDIDGIEVDDDYTIEVDPFGEDGASSEDEIEAVRFTGADGDEDESELDTHPDDIDEDPFYDASDEDFERDEEHDDDEQEVDVPEPQDRRGDDPDSDGVEDPAGHEADPGHGESDPESSDEEFQEVDDYETILKYLTKEWLKIELEHKVSKIASEAFWKLGKKWFHRLSNAKSAQNILRKTPCFTHNRRKLYNDYVPTIHMEFGYADKETGDITIVEDSDITPVGRFPRHRFRKLWEISHVEVTKMIDHFLSYFCLHSCT